MWNKRRNWVVWLRIRASSRIGWGFPVLLPVLEETLEEVHEFLSFWSPLLKSSKPRIGAFFSLPRAALELIREVRELGPCTLIQVKSEEVSVDVRLI